MSAPVWILNFHILGKRGENLVPAWRSIRLKWKKCARKLSPESGEKNLSPPHINLPSQTMWLTKTMSSAGGRPRSLAHTKIDINVGSRRLQKLGREGAPPWTAMRGNIIFLIFVMNCCSRKSRQSENQLATPRHPLKNQRSSRRAQCHPGVDKRNRCFWNIHHTQVSSNFVWIREYETYLLIFICRSWWTYSTITVPVNVLDYRQHKTLWYQFCNFNPGGQLYFKVDIIRIKRLSKSTLNTYFYFLAFSLP